MNNRTEHPRSLTWIFTASVIIGLAAGFIAWLFRLLIGLIHNIAFFGRFSTEYEVTSHTAESEWGWLIIFIPALGALVVVWITKHWSPEAKGPGISEVIDAIHYKQGKIPRRLIFTKALASSVTIGTGGSLGREGPIVQIGAALSATIAELFNLPVRQRIVLIGCGASAGIAATFNAPLAGLLFAIELLLVSINSQTILPVAISSAIGAYVGRLLMGPEPAFSIPHLYQADSLSRSLSEVVLFIPFGALMGLMAWILIQSLSKSEDFFERLKVNDYLRHAIGSLALGILFYSLFKLTGHYFVQGVGYATISDMVNGLLRSPWFLLMLVALKLVATCLTVGSGGSGGVFSPSLFMGAGIGSAFGHVMNLLFPSLGLDPATFAVVGMASIIGAATSAPLTAAIITYEMTLEYQVMLPVMISVSIAYALRRWMIPTDIYTMKLLRRGHIIPEGLSTDISGSFRVEHIMSRHFRVLEFNETFSSFDGLSIVAKNEQIIGVVNAFNRPVEYDIEAADMMHTGFIILRPNMSLMAALRYLKRSNNSFAVICQNAKPNTDALVGVLSESEISKVLEKTAEMHQGHY